MDRSLSWSTYLRHAISIDVIYLDGNRIVVHIENRLKPWRVAPVKMRAASVLELPGNTIQSTGTSLGDEIRDCGRENLGGQQLVNDAPNFLVEWSSPWHEFRTSIRPALSRSPEALSGEAPVGLFPYRGILVSWAFEIAFVIARIMLSAHLAEMHTAFSRRPPSNPKSFITAGEELPDGPRTLEALAPDATGRGGGHQAHHPDPDHSRCPRRSLTGKSGGCAQAQSPTL